MQLSKKQLNIYIDIIITAFVISFIISVITCRIIVLNAKNDSQFQFELQK